MFTGFEDAIVLVIEDDPDTRTSVGELLALEGYGAIEVESAEAGLSALRASTRPLVVLFDNVMPGLGGVGLLSAVLADNSLGMRHAYLLMTASPQRADAELHDALAHLGVPVIAKPFSVEVLLEAVAQAAQRLTASVEQKRQPD